MDFEVGGHASQIDLWALLKSTIGLASVAIEAKTGEGFRYYVDERLPKRGNEGSGKPKRLDDLKA